MGAFLKSLALMLLLPFTVSPRERPGPGLVRVEFELPHEVGAGPFRLVGNASVLGDGNALNAPEMEVKSSDYAVLYVDLTPGETYSVNVYVDVCPCPHEAKSFTVLSTPEVTMGVWLGDQACNIACQSPSPSPSPGLVTVEFELPHEVGAGPFRLVGNTSVLGDGNPLNAPEMEAKSSDYAALYVDLTAGETYSVNVCVDVCPCPHEAKSFTVLSTPGVTMGMWLGDQACNIACASKFMNFNSIRSIV